MSSSDRDSRERAAKSRPMRIVIFALIAAVLVFLGAKQKVITRFSDGFYRYVRTGDISSWHIPEGELSICFIDVGQAKSILIRSPGGENMLIDVGSEDSVPQLVKYLEVQEIKELDAVAITHPHEDHIGGLTSVLTEYGVKKLYISEKDGVFLPSGTVAEIPFDGEAFILGGCTVTFIVPDSESEDINDRSLIIKLEYGDFSAVFTGDIEKKTENLLLSNGYDIDIDLLDVAHHGSDTSSTDGFLDAATPSLAVISCGMDNAFGHPSPYAVERIESRNIPIYRTDTDGSVTVYYSEKDGVSVRTSK